MAASAPMQKHRDITLERFDKMLSPLYWTDVNLRSNLYPARQAVTDIALYSPKDRVPYDQAAAATYTASKVGEVVGPAWSTHWFRLRINLPANEEWQGKEVRLAWDSGSEAMVWIDGKALQGLNGSQGDDRRTDFVLTRKSKAGERWEVFIEVACNGMFGLGANGMIQPPDLSRTFTLAQADVVVADPEAWALFWDMTIVSDLARKLDPATPRSARALYVANQMLDVWDRLDRSTWAKARALAKDFLAKSNGQGQHQVFAVGHCHIDTAWLWPYDETKRKVARSWATALTLMDTHPDYKFCASTAQQFQWCKEQYPELYGRILKRVKEGRFIPVGGTWVEMDANLPCGESIVRQFLYGQKFFEQEFGFRATEFWLPDTFGYCSQIPQIMRGCGMGRFLTQKLSWSIVNKFPHSTFEWEGLDGSRVLAHFPPADTYASKGNVEEVLRCATNHKDKERFDSSLMLFGHGDGGGGPDVSHLEQLERLHDTDGCPKVSLSSPSDFFGQIEAEARLRPPLVWVGELYLELHQGTFTSQSEVKRRNRRCEVALQEIEALGSMLVMLKHKQAPGYDMPQVEGLWHKLLLNQFHDVIPGSAIGMVFEDAHKLYTEIETEAAALQDSLLAKLAESLTSTSTPNSTSTSTSAARNAPSLSVNLTGFPRQGVPPMGWAMDEPPSLQAASPPDGEWVKVPTHTHTHAHYMQLYAEASVVEGDGVMTIANGKLTAKLDTATGAVTSLLLHAQSCPDREMMEGPGGNRLRLYEDIPFYWDAWDIMPYTLEKGKDVGVVDKVEVLSKGGAKAGLRVAYRPIGHNGNSSVVQEVWLASGSDVLDITTHVDWHENRHLLKVEHTVAVRSDFATYETQFGCLRRPTHTNTTYDMAKWEVCGHRWADLSEHGAGLAMLNDSKYGHLTRGNVMALSLLRSPKAPDSECDMGQHTFRYGLFPHWGGPHDYDAQVVSRATHFNTSLHNVPLPVGHPPRGPSSLLTLEHEGPCASGIVLCGLKPAEGDASGSVIARLCETAGGRGAARLVFREPSAIARVCVCSLLEDEGEEVERGPEGTWLVSLGPFQVLTLKVVLR